MGNFQALSPTDTFGHGIYQRSANGCYYALFQGTPTLAAPPSARS